MIYQNILQLCTEQGLSLRQLEEKAGIGSGIIHNWRVRSIPRVDTLKQVADALGVTLDQLVSGAGTASGKILMRRNGEVILLDDFQSTEALIRKVRSYCSEGKGWTVTLEMGQQN